MDEIKENRAGYASEAQRELLSALGRDPLLQESFFLTGGTALSVFYLGHRVSDDLDFFTGEGLDLPAVTDLVLRPWAGKLVWIAREPSFASVLLRDVKVDFVVELFSVPEDRPVVEFEEGGRWAVDTPEAIAGNKLAAMAGRIEPKDFIDFYFLWKTFPRLEILRIFERAKRKDALFDDPKTAIQSIREGFEIVLRSAPEEAHKEAQSAKDEAGIAGRERRGPIIPFPRLFEPVDWRDFKRTFEKLFREILSF